MNASPLSRRDTAFLKGIAISLIVLHNFCHWLPLCVTENEYTFRTDRIWQYVSYLGHGGPHLLLNFFSHYGHYGVPLFLFLSGYGLVMKYERTKVEPIGVGTFMWRHACKLWWLMLPPLLAFFVIETIGGNWGHRPDQVFCLVAFVNNLQPVRDLILGPWWFFSLMMQLYLIYIVILRRWRGFKVLAAVVGFCWLLQAAALGFDWRMDWGQPDLDLFNYMRYNCIGSMLPFGVGIAMARWQYMCSGWRCQVLGLVLLLLSAFNALLWLVSPVFLLMATLPLVRLVKSEQVKAVFVWLGGISACLFAVHPVVRAYTIGMAKTGAVYTGLVLYLVLSIGLALLMTILLKARKRWQK